MKLRFKSSYFKWGLTAFIVGALLIIFFFSARSLGNVMRIVPILVHILQPFIIGFVFAYLLCPVYNGIVRRLRGRLTEHYDGDEVKGLRMSKLCSLILSVILLLLVISGLIYLVIPALIKTIPDLIAALPDTFRSATDWISVKAQTYIGWAPIERIVESGSEKIMEWLSDIVMPATMNIMDGVTNVLSTLLNVVIGFIVMVYMLVGKDIFAAQGKKVVCCLFDEERADKVLFGAEVVNHVFNRYISSNIIDGLIIGTLTFIFMAVTGFEYGALIAVVIGVTNLIPFFGPFIGAIPSALLLLSTTPIHALYFIIFIIVIQQVDGNIIKPRIFSEGVGLPSFWVMFAIIVGGGLFGFIGMLIGVPVFAVIYQFIAYKMNKRMRKKDLDPELTAYIDHEIYEKRETEYKGIFKRLNKDKDGKDENSEDDRTAE